MRQRLYYGYSEVQTYCPILFTQILVETTAITVTPESATMKATGIATTESAIIPATIKATRIATTAATAIVTGRAEITAGQYIC